VPLFVIGLTVVAVGTSLPELRVGLISAWYQSDQILLGNVAGANAINLVLI
jgi:cation:H+ antiporter